MTEGKPVGLRLIDGHEVIGYEYNSEDSLLPTTFNQLLRVAMHPSGQATLIPYVDIESFDDKIKIKEDHIILRYKPVGSIWEQHEKLGELLKQQKSGIITPNKKLIK
jgi:hypothetical protein